MSRPYCEPLAFGYGLHKKWLMHALYLIFPLLCLLLTACEPADRPIPDSQIANPNQLVSPDIAGRYQWEYSVALGEQAQVYTPENSGYQEELLISETLFTKIRDGQSVLYFPYVSLEDGEASLGNFRIYDVDWDRVRYRASLSSDQLTLVDQTPSGRRSYYRRLP